MLNKTNTHTDRFAVCNYLQAVGGKLNHQRGLMPLECNFKYALCKRWNWNKKERNRAGWKSNCSESCDFLICVHGSSAVYGDPIWCCWNPLWRDHYFSGPNCPRLGSQIAKKAKVFKPDLLAIVFAQQVEGFCLPRRAHTLRAATTLTRLFSLRVEWECVCIVFLYFFLCWCSRKVWNVSLVITTPLWVCARAKTTRERHWGGVAEKGKWRILGAHTLASFFHARELQREQWQQGNPFFGWEKSLLSGKFPQLRCK